MILQTLLFLPQLLQYLLLVLLSFHLLLIYQPIEQALSHYIYLQVLVSIHLIYGLGLGYLFQVASLNSKGTVILLETDLNILWFAFTLVDFSNDILKQNVFFTSSFEEASEAIYKKSGMKNIPQLLSTPAQRNLQQESFNELVIKLKEIIGSFSLDLKFTQEKFLNDVNNIADTYFGSLCLLCL